MPCCRNAFRSLSGVCERSSAAAACEAAPAIEHNVASGDFSVNRDTFRGAHTASGRRVEVTGIDMVRVRDGKLAEHWALLDSAAMRHQLGTGRFLMVVPVSG